MFDSLGPDRFVAVRAIDPGAAAYGHRQDARAVVDIARSRGLDPSGCAHSIIPEERCAAAYARSAMRVCPDMDARVVGSVLRPLI